ncbi:RDD family protein [Stieleria marina]|uniref:RDD family protein n=1 Tax=Stieleria marina TaxID=1930275 RepID=A0A517NVS8_9BACT|nr:RDD family protein [Planctomycetes bacterium K23_9]
MSHPSVFESPALRVDRSLGTGVYYDKDDYAGFAQRVAVVFIDGAVLLLMGAVLGSVVMVLAESIGASKLGAALDLSGIFMLLWIVGIWVYLAPLKRSRFRTVAYRLLGLTIVTTKGGRPTLFTMTLRILMWICWPFNFVVDLIWLGADTEGQTLRDCYASTYVVRHGAEPIGFAPEHLTRYNGAGMTLAYPRVCRPVANANKE